MTNSPAPADQHDHLFRVIYRDTDQMGMVYYANYFAYMEMGRVELMRAKGSSYRELEESGIFIPVVHAQCDYRRPARYDDLLRLRTTLVLLTRVRLHFRYQLHHDGRAELLATGETHHVFTGRDQRPVRVPPQVLEMLSRPVLG